LPIAAPGDRNATFFFGPEVQGMALDDDFQNRLTTWHGFTRFFQILTATVILVIIVLAFVTL
jgi:hypothetical protein